MKKSWTPEEIAKRTPPEIKHRFIIAFGRKFGMETLIETGTYAGETVEACLLYFSEIHSIELSSYFYNLCCSKFYGNSKVHLYNGDSTEILKTILPTIKSPALFWLDAHYSGEKTAKGSLDCPILEELKAITLLHPNSVLLIDDADLFPGYPGGWGEENPEWPNLDSLIFLANTSNLYFEIQKAIICLIPKR